MNESVDSPSCKHIYPQQLYHSSVINYFVKDWDGYWVIILRAQEQLVEQQRRITVRKFLMMPKQAQDVDVGLDFFERNCFLFLDPCIQSLLNINQLLLKLLFGCSLFYFWVDFI